MMDDAVPKTRETTDTIDIVVIEDASQIVHSLLRDLYHYWDEKRRGRRFPSRADLDPVDIPRLLPHVLLIDIHQQPFDLVYRLVGTQIVHSNGFEITGRKVRDLPISDAETLFTAYAQVARDGRPRGIQARFSTRKDRMKSVERVIMPLSNDGVTPDKLLGGAIFHAAAPAGHERFRMLGME